VKEMTDLFVLIDKILLLLQSSSQIFYATEVGFKPSYGLMTFDSTQKISAEKSTDNHLLAPQRSTVNSILCAAIDLRKYRKKPLSPF
jgi:hypothetical protein